MRLLVVGAGSTGGYFGGRLVQAGRDVTFLVRPRRAAQLQERGLQIVSPHGDATVRPKLVTTDDIDAPYDAVLLAVKAYSLDAAIDDFAAAVGPETTVVPVLNGMRHVNILQERFGKEAVGGGVCKVATTIDSDGRIVQLATFQELVYGERDGAVSPRMEALDAFMRGAGFDARLSRSIEYEMWEKWTLLAAVGGITCLMRGNIGEVVAAPGGPSFILSFLDEVVSVVSARRPGTEGSIRRGHADYADDAGLDTKPVDVPRSAAGQPDRGRSNHRRPARPRRESGHPDAVAGVRGRFLTVPRPVLRDKG